MEEGRREGEQCKAPHVQPVLVGDLVSVDASGRREAR